MNKYFFALGTNHTLSKIDIVNTLLSKSVDFEVIEASEEILIIATDTELDLQKLINELGSAAKVGIILKDKIKENLEENIEEIFTHQNLQSKFSRVKEKFGISIYGAGGKFKELNEIFYSRSKIAEKIRDVGDVREIRPAFAAPPAKPLAAHGKASAGEGRILSTVTVDKNKLLTEGFELVICVGAKGIYVGKTIAVQDYEGYSARDYGRPGRDAKSGMIPPKLAKMMINLCGKNKEETLLDPFCGSGTFLQEMIMLGYKDVIGSDVEEKAIENTKKNLEWLYGNFHLRKEEFKVDVFKSDVRTLSSKLSYKSADAIVSEPFLGSPNVRYLYPDQIKKELAKVEELYLSSFREFAKLLSDRGTIVIIFPVYRFKDQFFKLEILTKLKTIGFITKKFIDKKVRGEELLKLQITERGSVIFFRPGQSVSREIFVFQKV